MSELASTYGDLQHTRTALSRLGAVLHLPSESQAGVGNELSRVKGALEFRGVHFTYPGRDKTLEGLNLVVSPGEVVGLTGVNGAGKSTLVNLLMRFVEPQEGRILRSDRDVRSGR